MNWNSWFVLQVSLALLIITSGIISSEAASLLITGHSLHPVDLRRVNNLKQLIENVSASSWFKIQRKSNHLCPYTWKVSQPVHNRFPRHAIEAECNDQEKCKFCDPLYYHLLVRFTGDGKKIWRSYRVVVAFIRIL